mmetsp:Transcript_6531/g.9671  ORF Transcript_6531/g.9671 Transcript_6531/m.9671 type:complete len:82 (+) Transcript_6531:51-296(+)
MPDFAIWCHQRFFPLNFSKEWLICASKIQQKYIVSSKRIITAVLKTSLFGALHCVFSLLDEFFILQRVPLSPSYLTQSFRI